MKAHACCIFATLRSKMLHCNTKRPGRVSCKTNFIFQPLGYINMVEMEIQLQPFLSVVPHPPATSLPNTQFIYHLSLTTVNHQHVLNTQATRVAMQTHVRPSEFADDIPNPTTLNHELQSRIPEHVLKTKHAAEIARVLGNSGAEET